MPNKSMMSLKGGVNWRLPAWHKDFETRNQCVLLQNLRCKDDYIETIPGSKKFHGTTMGAKPVTAIIPYYNDQTDEFKLLVACGDSFYRRDRKSTRLNSSHRL